MRSASARRHAATGHHQLERLLRRHRAHQRHGDHVGPEPDVDLGRAEHGVVGRHHQVAGQGQAHAAGQREPVHPGDGRLAEIPQVPEQGGHLAAAVVQVEVARPGRHPGEIGAGAEGLVARAGDHHDPCLGIGSDLGQPGPHLGQHRPRQGVATLGPVDREPGDAVGQLVAQLGTAPSGRAGRVWLRRSCWLAVHVRNLANRCGPPRRADHPRGATAARTVPPCSRGPNPPRPASACPKGPRPRSGRSSRSSPIPGTIWRSRATRPPRSA